MTHRSLHVQELQAVKASSTGEHYFLLCAGPSGGTLDIRLPVTEAKKLHALLEDVFQSSMTAAA